MGTLRHERLKERALGGSISALICLPRGHNYSAQAFLNPSVVSRAPLNERRRVTLLFGTSQKWSLFISSPFCRVQPETEEHGTDGRTSVIT